MKRFGGILLGLLLSCGNLLHAGSAQIYPADMRQDRSIQLIGERNNSIFLRIHHDNQLMHKLPAFDTLNGKLALEFTFPEKLRMIGIENYYSTPIGEFLNAEQCRIGRREIGGLPYTVYRLNLDDENIRTRLIENPYFIDVYLWVEAPRALTGEFFWSLSAGNRKILESRNPLKVVGTVTAKTFSPDFFVHINQGGFDIDGLADATEIDKRVRLVKELGVTHINVLYYDERVEKNAVIAAKLNALGIHINAERGGSFIPYLYQMAPEMAAQNGGLVGGAEMMRRDITSQKEIEALKKTTDYSQGFAYDLETWGVKQSPGQDDDATIQAFGKNIGRLDMNRALAAGEFKDAYLAYRMRLLATPVFGARELVDAVKPAWPIFLCHGSGVPLHELDYKVYDNQVQYHLPMIYTGDSLTFLQKIEDFNDYIDRKKSIPTTSYGWSGGPLSRSGADEIAMDIAAAAVGRSKGISMWPGMRNSDGGILYGIYLGQSYIKDAVPYLQQGKPAADVRLEALPYVVNRRKIGVRTIDLSQPQWAAVSAMRAFEHQGEYLLAALNTHREETLFVRPFLDKAAPEQHFYCINLVDNHRLAHDGKDTFTAAEIPEKLLLEIPAYRPGFWLLTTDHAKAVDLPVLEVAEPNRRFEARKALFVARNQAADIALGSKGAITVSYENQVIGTGPEQLVLTVTTPEQKLGLVGSGGRIMQWTVDGEEIVQRNLTDGGLGMDMFYLPVNGRWSGDQIAEMKLLGVSNDGKTVRIVYSGKAERAISGFRLEKTYIVTAGEANVTVEVKLLNENPDPISYPAYWSHNVFDFSSSADYYYINKDGGIAVVRPDQGGTFSSYIANRELRPENKKYLDVNGLSGSGANRIGVFSAQSGRGVMLEVPEDFMFLYVWGRDAVRSLEFMMQPVAMQCGRSVVLRYSFTAYRGDRSGFDALLLKNRR